MRADEKKAPPRTLLLQPAIDHPVASGLAVAMQLNYALINRRDAKPAEIDPV